MDTQVILTNEQTNKRTAAKRVTSIALQRDLLAKLDARARKAKVYRNWIVERILEGGSKAKKTARRHVCVTVMVAGTGCRIDG
jgi:metal-responsive CopG/Arc/MetJ family transcriptional regulator